MIDQILKSGTFPPVLLLFGAEDLLVEETAQQLYTKAAEADMTGMNCEILDGEGMTLDAVLSLARSFPMMSDRRVLWVRRFDKLSASKDKKGKDRLLDYLSEPMPSTILILTANIPSADGISSAMQRNKTTAERKIKGMKGAVGTLLGNAPWIEFPRMKEQQLVAWVSKRAAEHGLKITTGVAEFIVARSGTSLRELSMEIDKLVTFLGDRTDVREEDVLEVVGAGREYNIFELQKAIGQRDLAISVKILTKMMETDRQEMLILSMLTRYFMALYRLIDAASLSDRAEIARVAGIPPFAVAEHLDVLSRTGPRFIERGLHELRRAESTIKSSSTDSTLVLQTMLARMFAEPARK